MRAMLALGIEVVTSTDQGIPIVVAMVERLRLTSVVVPAASMLERIALIARTQARRTAFGVEAAPADDPAAHGLEHLRGLGGAGLSADDDGFGIEISQLPTALCTIYFDLKQRRSGDMGLGLAAMLGVTPVRPRRGRKPRRS